MQLSALSEDLSNANVIDHCIPQLTKHRKVEHCMTAESNGQLLNTEMIAGQSIAVDEASMHSESMNDSQTSSITEKQAETESSTFLSCNVLSTRKRIYRYPGDIKDELIDQMTSASKSQCIRLLQSVCKAKDKKIKTLMLKKLRHTKKIVNLVKLLRELRQKCDLSENASEIIEV
ncbi:uncharacterized protein LOC109861196 [Pseudomyrmex gracilis]|uniref:uncharacterized protein LOC109861196 n=1 Tax=Pseudomyrmex gracilis TaxID=219809 RepID=UPI0009950251|nr:uncharacterized protein LOC109861196 [Pseudomyrmex gracilis]